MTRMARRYDPEVDRKFSKPGWSFSRPPGPLHDSISLACVRYVFRMDTAVLEKKNTSGNNVILSASVTPCCSRVSE